MVETLTTDERLHAICKTIREDTWAGIDETKALCHGCPASEDSPYGPGTRGCYLLALEVFNIAVHGDRLGPRTDDVPAKHGPHEPTAHMRGAKDCEKCRGAGWLWGRELDNPDEDTYADTMTKYTCDGEKCRALSEE